MVSNLLLNGSLGLGGEEKLGKGGWGIGQKVMDSLGLKASGTVGSGISKSNSGSDSLLTDLNKAITTQLSENSGLSEQMSKAASQVNSDQFAQTNAFKEAASK